ncbi:MAG: chromosomal replication initiator protein DnaA [Candidatus Nealsonbacteria bacterium CG_4_10_14_0_2_um_filter_40_15]|uniref:Chromosomal replication initiator protein DnaA n=1 Tax=Candidatus Nealsonbacteria bacterium CG_4_10_14_0_2_um_filter_40_15 TaxID=1974682 RepID=A0A2M7UUX3_9BACT|nr:MAG: chromosomal replication initiator protein DnaA [Candidatus Nealsonbacteria bacterium CG_4_10_14_0_2_um_filter_40_15]
MDLDELWKAALGEIELQISRANFKTWLQNTFIADKKGGVVTIAVPNSFTKEWLENKYHKFILRSLRNLESEIKEVNYQIKQNIIKEDFKGRNVFKEEDKIIRKQLDFQELNVNTLTNLNPRYTFDNFVVGPSNELAHAAALAVTKNLGKKYNPLFIYGGVGLGKTHLIQALGNQVKKDNQVKKVKYVTSERFTSEVISAIRSGSLRPNDIDDFKKRWREIDLLIIDDIQFLAGKEKTQEEFFYTFNALYDANKQIVLSSDRPPKSIQTLEERLRSRFEGGMTADISYPDLETRIAILRSKAGEKSVTLSNEVLEYIAQNIKKNVRELEGALNRLIAANYQLNQKELNLNDVKKILNSILNTPKKSITLKNVIKAVAEFYDVSEKDLLERSRKKEIVKPRQVIMYLLREELKSSFPFIGLKIGGRDHTTAIHACEKIRKEIELDSSLNDEINLIKEKLYLI